MVLGNDVHLIQLCRSIWSVWMLSTVLIEVAGELCVVEVSITLADLVVKEPGLTFETLFDCLNNYLSKAIGDWVIQCQGHVLDTISFQEGLEFCSHKTCYIVTHNQHRMPNLYVTPPSQRMMTWKQCRRLLSNSNMH